MVDTDHTREQAAPASLSPLRRNVSMVAVLVSMLMANIDTSIVNVALPQLATDLDATAADTIWVATAYLMAVACALPIMIGVADQLGRKRMFVLGTALFTIASLACALAPDLQFLIVSRVVQGISASLVFAVAIPIYRQLFPPAKLGTVLGLNAMTVAVGTCAGPTLGGLILANLSWPWLFLINIPLGAIAVILAQVAMPYRSPVRGRFDVAGSVLAAAAIATFLLGVHQLADVSTLWIAGILLASCAILVVVFIRTERRSPAPVIPMGMFNGMFSLSILTAFWSFFGQGVAFVALPFLFQIAYGATPLESALLFTPWPLIIVIVAPLAGRLADRYDSAKLAITGLTIFTGGLLSLALLGGSPPQWRVLLCTGITGLGFAIFQSPNNRDMMSAAPLALAGPAAGMLNINRTLSQSAGAGAVSMALVLSGASVGSLAAQASAANSVLFVAVAGAAVSVVVSALKLRGRQRTL